MGLFGVVVIVVLLLLFLVLAVRILREYERAVIFRLGRSIGVKGPGLIILIPFVDRMVKVSLRTIAHDVERPFRRHFTRIAIDRGIFGPDHFPIAL